MNERIDFTITAAGICVAKYHRINGRDCLHESKLHPPDSHFNVKAALAWCEQNGYTVRTWPAGCGFQAGARAFKGAPWPIRTRYQIADLRRKIEAQVAAWIRRNPGKPTPGLTFLDFAFDM